MVGVFVVDGLRETRIPESGCVLRRITACGLVVLLAGVAGWVMPRGPVTTLAAFTFLAAAVGIGFAVGRLSSTRWAIPLTIVVFMGVFEVARSRVDGPTVDGIALSGAYEVMALVAGRGIDAVLMLLPLGVGTAWGLSTSRALPQRRHSRPVWVRSVALVVATGAVALLAAGLLRPASTATIVNAQGMKLAGSIAELVQVPIGGHDQSIMIRGTSTSSPVLLFLEGGPGGTGIGRIRHSGEALEEDFVVAVWDQRGTGKSFRALEPAETLTLDQMVRDTVEVTRYLLGRFDQDRLYLVGSSWGTIIGTLAVQDHPELFHAWIGTGQMVDPFETDQLMYEENLHDARTRGDASATDRLEAMGPPPYEDTLDYPVAISSNPKWMQFKHGHDYDPSSEYPLSLFVDEYELVDQLRGMAAIAETFHVLYPQLAKTDFRRTVPELQVPVHLVQGDHEAAGREVLAREWFDLLEAPEKHYVVFEQSGHTPPYDEPGRFAEYMAGIAVTRR